MVGGIKIYRDMTCIGTLLQIKCPPNWGHFRFCPNFFWFIIQTEEVLTQLLRTNGGGVGITSRVFFRLGTGPTKILPISSTPLPPLAPFYFIFVNRVLIQIQNGAEIEKINLNCVFLLSDIGQQEHFPLS